MQSPRKHMSGIVLIIAGVGVLAAISWIMFVESYQTVYVPVTVTMH